MTPLRNVPILLLCTALLGSACQAQTATSGTATAADWLAQWQNYITNDCKDRNCDRENAEELAWLVAPYMEGFYYGYLATGDPKWADMFIDWTDSWVKRAVKEPDGFPGWPKLQPAGTDVDHLNDYDADSLLGEAVMLRPVVLMAGVILHDPALKEKYGAKAASYIQLAKVIYQKWDQRGVWRMVDTEYPKGEPMVDDHLVLIARISVVLPFGIDQKTGKWTDGYATRNDPHVGFSHPDNKANMVARWLLAMSDVTGDPVYKERAGQWFQVMKSRMTLKPDGTYDIWNYWQPAGPWDYKPDGSTKHWVGVHPNAGYYQVDVQAIADAFQHGIVFTKKDIGALVKTGLADNRTWEGLVPYSPEIRKRFESSFKPGTWGGMSAVPRYLYWLNSNHLAFGAYPAPVSGGAGSGPAAP